MESEKYFPRFITMLRMRFVYVVSKNKNRPFLSFSWVFLTQNTIHSLRREKLNTTLIRQIRSKIELSEIMCRILQTQSITSWRQITQHTKFILFLHQSDDMRALSSKHHLLQVQLTGIFSMSIKIRWLIITKNRSTLFILYLFKLKSRSLKTLISQTHHLRNKREAKSWKLP